jgi:hypothetical protein
VDGAARRFLSRACTLMIFLLGAARPPFGFVAAHNLPPRYAAFIAASAALGDPEKTRRFCTASSVPARCAVVVPSTRPWSSVQLDSL